jgi:hypothetical protein
VPLDGAGMNSLQSPFKLTPLCDHVLMAYDPAIPLVGSNQVKLEYMSTQ